MEKTHLYDKILSPFVTEKSTNLSEQNKIVFKAKNDPRIKGISSESKNGITKISKAIFTSWSKRKN